MIKKISYPTAFVCLLLCIVLGILSQWDPLQKIDLKIYGYMQSLANPFWLQWHRFFTFFGEFIFLLPATFLLTLILYQKKSRFIVWPMVVFALCQMGNYGLKIMYQRARPVGFLGNDLTTYSYPSGHAAGALVFYGIVYMMLAPYLNHKRLFFALSTLMILSIGVSRIALGVHWASDVVGGYLLGLCILVIFRSQWRVHK